MQPAVTAHHPEQAPVKGEDVPALRMLEPVSSSHFPQGVHGGGYLHLLGAAGGADLTTDTEPDGQGAGPPLHLAALKQPHHPGGGEVHIGGQGAAGGTAAALDAAGVVLAGESADLLEEPEGAAAGGAALRGGVEGARSGARFPGHRRRAPRGGRCFGTHLVRWKPPLSGQAATPSPRRLVAPRLGGGEPPVMPRRPGRRGRRRAWRWAPGRGSN